MSFDKIFDLTAGLYFCIFNILYMLVRDQNEVEVEVMKSVCVLLSRSRERGEEPAFL